MQKILLGHYKNSATSNGDVRLFRGGATGKINKRTNSNTGELSVSNCSNISSLLGSVTGKISVDNIYLQRILRVLTKLQCLHI